MPTATRTSASAATKTGIKRATQIRILADDLTGACDAAAAFLTTGHSARVWLGRNATEPVTESVQAFNTASRALAPEQAAAAVSQAAMALFQKRPSLFFKKVDSAGRGNYAAEVLAAHHYLGTRAILLAPSFPAAGRSVSDGLLTVEDASGTTRLPLILLFQHHLPTAQIQHAGQISRSLAAGAKILVCDASTQAELESYACLDEPNLLYAGSAGLAYALAKFHPSQGVLQRQVPFAARPVTISGTRHHATRKQLKHLASALPDHPLLEIPAAATDASHILAHFERYNTDALVLTGGDTALLVLETLGATSIVLRGELAPGIPWGVVQGGLAHGRIVVTKSGGFGAPDALTRILHTLLDTERNGPA